VVTNEIKRMVGVEEEGRATNVSGSKGEERRRRTGVTATGRHGREGVCQMGQRWWTAEGQVKLF
jgi:hypothetical protein